MKVKLETKSNRVKGLCFHPCRPWLLASLHNGQILLWDHRISQLIDKFEGHEGPVRAVDFHCSQPIFVSGGDDYRMKVWNYKSKKCTFSSNVHLDYIRTVKMHDELPWILSASDDQTIQIWNHQNRSHLATLAGHSHYVMCAQFHGSQDLIVSCSLDQTIRVWDYSNLKKKYQQGSQWSDKQDQSLVEIKFVLEGHDRGVNWVAFHDQQNLIVSGGDDRKLKMWKFNDSKGWEYDTIYGHTNNVCCVAFNTKHNLILSVGEDKHFKVWDANKRLLLKQTKRDDRYWIIAQDVKQDLVAIGHDSGFTVLNLVKKRVVSAKIDSNRLVFVKGGEIILWSNNQPQKVLVEVELDEQQSIKTIYHNCYEKEQEQIMVNIYNKEEKMNKYHLFEFSKGFTQLVSRSEHGYCMDACFISKNKMLKLKDGDQTSIQIYDYEKQLHKQQQQISSINNRIFIGGINRVIYQSDDQIYLYDLNSNNVINKIQQSSRLKQVLWNEKRSTVILVCQKVLIVCNKDLNMMNQVVEKFTIKSGIFSGDSVIYNTCCYLKYMLVDGDNGLLKCMDRTVQVVELDRDNGSLRYIDRKDKEIKDMGLDLSEMEFKEALIKKEKNKINQQMNGQLLGDSMVAHLYRKNYSGLAMRLIQDQKAKFELAIDSGNIQLGYELCQALRQPEMYNKLGMESLRQGNLQLYELCLQNGKQFDQLSFMYLLDGNREKLGKMMEVGKYRGDVMSVMQNAMYLGNVEERIRVLAEQGQLVLAYLMSIVHDEQEMAIELKNNLDQQQLEQCNQYLENKYGDSKIPFVSLNGCRAVRKVQGQVSNFKQNQIKEEQILLVQKDNVTTTNNENDVDDMDIDNDSSEQINEQQKQQNNDLWNDDIDIDLDDEIEEELDPQTQQQVVDGTVNVGSRMICNQQNPIMNHIIRGNFEQALSMIRKQTGLGSNNHYRQLFIELYQQQELKVGLTGGNFIMVGLKHEDQISIQGLKQSIVQGGLMVDEYRLEDSLHILRKVIKMVPLLNKDPNNEWMDVIRSSREIIVAVLMEIQKKSTQSQEQIVAINLMHCGLSLPSKQQLLFLKASMLSLYKLKCYIYSSWVADKILSVLQQRNEQQNELYQKATKVRKLGAQQGKNEIEIDGFRKEWINNIEDRINTNGWNLIKEGQESQMKRCSVCHIRSSDKGSECIICQIGVIGAEVVGIRI